MTLLFNIGFLELRMVDIIDIILVTLLFVQLYKLLRGSVALRVFIGLLSLYLLYLVVKALRMELLTTILGQFMGVGVLATIILFQQEIRRFLMVIGRTASVRNMKIFNRLPWQKNADMGVKANLTPVIEAIKSLGATNTGALIVFSDDDEMKFYIQSGDKIGAELSKRLLVSIFNKDSPLHDGAVIIQNNRIAAARCILPVTEKDDLPAQYGLRHRAAIGISEATNCIVLIVSEETGQLSIARNGRLYNNLSTSELRERLNKYFTEGN